MHAYIQTCMQTYIRPSIHACMLKNRPNAYIHMHRMFDATRTVPNMTMDHILVTPRKKKSHLTNKCIYNRLSQMLNQTDTHAHN